MSKVRSAIKLNPSQEFEFNLNGVTFGIFPQEKELSFAPLNSIPEFENIDSEEIGYEDDINSRLNNTGEIFVKIGDEKIRLTNLRVISKSGIDQGLEELEILAEMLFSPEMQRANGFISSEQFKEHLNNLYNVYASFNKRKIYFSDKSGVVTATIAGQKDPIQTKEEFIKFFEDNQIRFNVKPEYIKESGMTRFKRGADGQIMSYKQTFKEYVGSTQEVALRDGQVVFPINQQLVFSSTPEIEYTIENIQANSVPDFSKTEPAAPTIS